MTRAPEFKPTLLDWWQGDASDGPTTFLIVACFLSLFALFFFCAFLWIYSSDGVVIERHSLVLGFVSCQLAYKLIDTRLPQPFELLRFDITYSSIHRHFRQLSLPFPKA